MELTKLHEELKSNFLNLNCSLLKCNWDGEIDEKLEFEELELSDGITAVFNATIKGKRRENYGDWWTPSTYSYVVEVKVTHVHYYDYNGESIGSADNPICLTLNQ